MIRALTLCAAMIATPAYALDVRNDMGGSVDARAAQIHQLRADDTPVQIIGTCVSACTMLRAEFDRVSVQMAAHYPPQIAAWFMRKGRMMTGGYYTITGAEAIRMGARECQ